jgi:carbonic anhydrase
MRQVLKRKQISERQRRWLYLYLTTAHLNATRAAREVGYKWPNHSGPENLQKLRAQIDVAMSAGMYRQPEVVEKWVWTL